MNNCKRIFHIDLARTVAIMSITCNHAIEYSFNIRKDTLKEFLSIPFLFSIIKSVIFVFSRVGVPLFLMISGALLLKRDYSDIKELRKFVFHNYLQLFITVEIWLTIHFWYMWLLPGSSHLYESDLLIALGYWITTCLFINQVTFSSMWYMKMILCVYLLIPIISIALKFIPHKYFAIPISIIVISSMLFPDINRLLIGLGYKKHFVFGLNSHHVFSMFLVYVILGYFINNGLLAKFSSGLISVLFGFVFIVGSGFQFWLYTTKSDGYIAYSSFILLLISVLAFEIIRRSAFSVKTINEKFNVVIKTLADYAFGIYFVHICIMHGLVQINCLGRKLFYLKKFAFIEITSLIGSIIIIYLFSKINFCKKNLFVIKRE